MKAISRSARFPALALLAVIAAAGCDSYSLLDAFSLPYRIAEGGPLELSYEGSGVVVGRDASVALIPRGGVPPYSYEVQAGAVSPLTLGWDLGSVSNNVYSAGDAIGQVMVILTDSELRTDTVVVTVLPFAPSFSSITRNGVSGNATINYNHGYVDAIDQFVVERKAEDESVFSSVYSGPLLSCGDSGLSDVKQYTYRVKAVSGVYSSPWTVSEPI